MTRGLIISQQTEGEKVETVTCYFLGLQNHFGQCCSHEIKDACSLEGKL